MTQVGVHFLQKLKEQNLSKYTQRLNQVNNLTKTNLNTCKNPIGSLMSHVNLKSMSYSQYHPCPDVGRISYQVYVNYYLPTTHLLPTFNPPSYPPSTHQLHPCYTRASKPQLLSNYPAITPPITR